MMRRLTPLASRTLRSAQLSAVRTELPATARTRRAEAAFVVVAGVAAMLLGQANAFAEPILGLDSGGHTGWVVKLLVNAYSGELISVSHDKTIRFWSLETGESVRVLHPPIGRGFEGRLYAAALAPGGRLLAIGGASALTAPADHRVLLVALPEGNIVGALRGHTAPIRDLAFSPDGARLASGSDDLTARIWDPLTGQSLQTLAGHRQRVNSVAWSPDGATLATGSWDGVARLWSAATGAVAAALRHGDEVMNVAWLPDGRTVVTGGGQMIKLWRPTGELLYAWNGLPLDLQSLAVSPDGKRLLYAWGNIHSDDRGAAVLNVNTGAEISRFRGHRNTPMSGVFVGDRGAVVTGAASTEIVVWDGERGAPLRRLAGRGGPVRSVAWSADGSRIAWGHADSPGTAIHATHPLERTFDLARLEFGPPPDSSYRRAIESADGLSVRRASDRVAQISRYGAPLASYTLNHRGDKIRSQTLLPGGRVALGSTYGVMIFNALDGRPIFQLPGHTDTVWALAPSPDGRYLLSGSGDETVEIWNLANYQLVLSFFAADADWIAWTPQGYYAASLGGENLMGWHVNHGPEAMGDFYAASQFHKAFYRPDAIRRLLQFGDLWRARDDADRVYRLDTEPIVLSAALPPRVTIVGVAAAGSPAPEGTPSTSEGTPSTALTTPRDAALETAADAPRAELQSRAKTPDAQRQAVRELEPSPSGEYEIVADATPAGANAVTELRLIVDGKTIATRDASAGWQSDPSTDAASQGRVKVRFHVPLSPGDHEIVIQADTAKSFGLSAPLKLRVPSPVGSAAADAKSAPPGAKPSPSVAAPGPALQPAQ